MRDEIFVDINKMADRSAAHDRGNAPELVQFAWTGVTGSKRNQRRVTHVQSRILNVTDYQVPDVDRISVDIGIRIPDKASVTDITYIRTQEGLAYLDIGLELFSRRILGW